MDPVITALLGGSIGSIITLIGTVTIGVPAEVRHHDRLAIECDEDLAQWVSDECVRLERELAGHMNGAGNQLYSGSYLSGIAALKEEALHLYRDQERAAKRRRAALLDDEGWRHRAYRWWIVRDQLPQLTTPTKAIPILDGWREEIQGSGGPAPVSDATKRSLDWAIGKYRADEEPWKWFAS